jgi:TPR repeat protein
LFHLQRAADLGNPHAQYWMGNILASGIYSSIETTSSSHIQITDDVGHGKSQLARAIIQWYFASIQGIQEAQMALGYRYLSAFQATGGGGSAKTNTDGGFGVVGDCATALAYYEEAANAAMDEMESSELRGKIPPATDRHRLAEMHMHGASSALAHHNKPGR